MSRLAIKAIQAAAGAAAGGGAVYVDDVFSTYLYDGANGSTSNQAVTVSNGIDLYNEGGLIWFKRRDAANGHALFDSQRDSFASYLRTEGTNTPSTLSGHVTANSNGNGFTLSSTGYGITNNTSPATYASWTFRKQPGFFDVVTYTGTGSAQSINHSLGSAPGMIIVKDLNVAYNWMVYHRSLGGYNYYLHLNTTDGRFNNSSVWQSEPTNSTFSVGHSWNNNNGSNYVAYLFAHDAQDFGTDSDEAIIKCGSYVGNGTSSSSTQHIDLGFEPQFFLVKVSHNSIGGSVSGQEWFLVDTMRGFVNNGNNFDDKRLMPSTSDAEAGYPVGHPTPTGIQLIGDENETNKNSHTYIYMAIRRPHKPASEFAATDLFSMDGAGSATNPAFESNNHIVDMGFQKRPTATDAPLFFSRLTGDKYLNSTSSAAEATGSSISWDYMDGMLDSFSATSYQAWMFRRAPGFFDVVAYDGSLAAQEISHNLGVAPELIIQKCRTQASYPWNSWYAGLTNSQYINLNQTNGVQTSSNLWGTNATVATDSVFRVGSGNTGVDGGTSDKHIAYLFATAPGISKVGTFNRPSQVAQDIDCGFTSGARFVLLKRTNTTGQWVVWDSVRGIVAGNDPYFALQSTAAQVTSQDYIDPLSSGFTITSGILTGDWLFLAIA